MVVRFVCVIRVPVCARVSRVSLVCPVCVPCASRLPGVFLPVQLRERLMNVEFLSAPTPQTGAECMPCTRIASATSQSRLAGIGDPGKGVSAVAVNVHTKRDINHRTPKHGGRYRMDGARPTATTRNCSTRRHSKPPKNDPPGVFLPVQLRERLMNVGSMAPSRAQPGQFLTPRPPLGPCPPRTPSWTLPRAPPSQKLKTCMFARVIHCRSDTPHSRARTRALRSHVAPFSLVDWFRQLLPVVSPPA